MEESLKFNSQVCTNLEQSKKLLELGLKPETADMHITTMSSKGINYTDDWQIGSIPYCNVISFLDSKGLYLEKTAWSIYPAWSLHRLLLLCDVTAMFTRDILKTAYDDQINTIENLIKNGYFNKEYLKQ